MTESLDNLPPSNVVPLPARSNSTLTPALAASLTAATSWLQNWTPAEPVPDGERTKLPALIVAAEQHAAPASPEAFAIAMKPLVEWVQRFGIVPLEPTEQQGGQPGVRRAQVAEIVRGYRDALSDIPGDILADAVKATVDRHAYRNLPTPGDIRIRAETEMRERSDRLRRLRTAKMFADRQAKSRAAEASDAPRERTPEELAAVAAAKEAAIQARSEGPVKAIPAERDDLKPQRDDSAAAARRRVAEGLAGFRKIARNAQPWGA